MFERFTSRARHVIVLAQEEARGLQHNYIGTEHILLGLLGEPSEIAARALGSFGISLASAREEVTARIGIGKKPLQGHIPFTPRAKKTLELALREALAMQHNYIGTEHILLGVIREGDGVAAQILAEQAGDLGAVRKAVLDLVPPAQAPRGLRWLRRRGAPPSPGEPGEEEQDELRTTPAADSSLSEAARLAGGARWARTTCCSPPSLIPTPPPPGRLPLSASTWSRRAAHSAMLTLPAPATRSPRKPAAAAC